MSDIKNKLDFLSKSHKELTGSDLSNKIAKSYVDLFNQIKNKKTLMIACLLYTSDAADEEDV